MFTERGKKTQKKVYDYICTWIEKRGYPPSIREIGRGVGLASTKAVKYHVDNLVNQGLLRRRSRRARALGAAAQSGGLPLLGRIAAGQPILAVENVEERVSLSRYAGCFLLRVRGESMSGVGILDGDLVIVRPQTAIRDGQIVAVQLDGEAMVKRFYRQGASVTLTSENPQFQPIELDPASREFRILGSVVGVLRDYGT